MCFLRTRWSHKNMIYTHQKKIILKFTQIEFIDWWMKRNQCELFFLWYHQYEHLIRTVSFDSKRTIPFIPIFSVHHTAFVIEKYFIYWVFHFHIANWVKCKMEPMRLFRILRFVYILLTRYPPKCRTWQVNVASRPTATEIFTIGSANSGWNVRTSGKDKQQTKVNKASENGGTIFYFFRLISNCAMSARSFDCKQWVHSCVNVCKLFHRLCYCIFHQFRWWRGIELNAI